MDKIRTLALFMSTIESGSFSATAKLHATDPSTVSKAIKRLENQIGIQLFYRSTRKLSLTSAGEKYANTVGNLYQQLESYEEELKSENNQHSGSIKVNLPVSYGRLYVLPMLCEFQKIYPDIQLDISFNDEYVDMISNAIDISIRSGTLSDSRLVAQKLTPMEFVLCASYDMHYDIELTQSHLKNLPWLLFRFKQTGKIMPIEFDYQGKHIDVDPKHHIIVDDGEALAELCAAGAGLTLMPHFLVKDFVINKKIRILAKIDDFQKSGIYIVYPKREFLPKRTQLFIQFMKDFLAQRGETSNQTWLADLN